jgi:predicted XRE-type DNA-binding protein
MSKKYERSGGNAFADLGLPNSEQEQIKARLTVEICRLIRARGMTQSKTAELLGTTEAHVSALMRWRPVAVFAGRLMEFQTILGQDVQVTVKPAPRKPGRGIRSTVRDGTGDLTRTLREHKNEAGLARRCVS